MTDPLVMPIALEMLECLESEMSQLASAPAFVGLRPGVVVDHLISQFDDECCSGLAWVRPVRTFPTTSFPDPDGSPTKDGPLSYAVVLELGSVRCAPTAGPTEIPSVAAWNETVQRVMEDAAAIRRAICCYIASGERRWQRVLVGDWEPLDVEGGCVGGIQTVTVRGPACDCSQIAS